MLDLLLIPAGLFLALALRAVRRGEHRLHGHLMTAAFTLVGLRLLLHTGSLTQVHLSAWGLTLAAAGTAILLGRKALAWREGRSARSGIPRVHRAAGALTLVLASLTLVMWFLRER